MEVVFEVTDRFEKDLERFGSRDQKIIEKKINYYAHAFQENPDSIHVYAQKPHFPLILKSGLTASLYVLRININIRLIATFDADPVFDQVIITLLACIRHDEYERVYRSIAANLYNADIVDINVEGENYDPN